MNDNSTQKRLLLSRLLAFGALILLISTYCLGPIFEYIDPVTGEIEFDEENLSFQPFAFLIPKDTPFRAPAPEVAKLMNEKIYEYFPTGLWAFLIGYKTIPVWRVSLEAPQYPKATYPEGVPVYFTLTDFRGKVVEMNVINHYIGMDPMEVGAITVRSLVPFVYLAFSVMLVALLFYNGPGWWLLGLIPAFIPWYYLGFYSYWLYWFGHNLHEYGAFSVKPFMPTVLGDGKVAQFTTHSYPEIGFYLLLAVFILALLAVLIKRRALQEMTSP